MATKNDTEQLRAEFEAWASGRCELYLVNPAGRYSSATTQFAWEAYQAGRAALQSQDRDKDRIDAERYRWLRADNAYFPEENHIWGGQELDEAIDHARRIEEDGE